MHKVVGGYRGEGEGVGGDERGWEGVGGLCVSPLGS